MNKTKQHLLKKVALVAITITSVAATTGVAEAGKYTTATKTTTGSVSPYDDGGYAPAFRSGIRW